MMLWSTLLLRSPTQRYSVLALLPCCGRGRINTFFTTTNQSPLMAKEKDKDCGKSGKGSKGKKNKDGKGKEPVGRRPIHPGKVRHGFLPEEWFSFFYEKTGVTGPYVFGVSLLNYLFSKEIYVCEHEYYSGLSMAILAIIAVKKLGPPLAKYLDKEIADYERYWKKARKDEIKRLQEEIDLERRAQEYAKDSLLLLEMKRYNIDVQLETAHRKELMKVYEQVKHRLDYQVACGNITHRINHKNMVLWLRKEVLNALPDADPETREKFKADLSAMALRAKL